MTEVVRKTFVKRFYKQDLDSKNELIPGTEDKAIWVDIEMWDGMTTERGSGVDFMRDNWTFDWESAERESKYIKVYDPNDKSVYVPVKIPESILVEKGSGVDYARQKWIFDNSEDNDRRGIRVDRVYHADQDGTIDKSQYVDFEVGETYVVEFGSGVDFVRQTWTWDNSQIPLDPDLPENQYRVDGQIWISPPSARETINPESADPPVYTETSVGAPAP